MRHLRVKAARWLKPFLHHLGQDEEEVRRSRLLIALVLALVPAVSIGLATRWILAPLETGTVVTVGMSLALLVTALLLLRRSGQPDAPGLLALTGLYLLVVGPAWYAAGLNTPALMVAPLIPMAAAYLRGPGGGFHTLLVLLPTLLVFGLLHHRGVFDGASPVFGPAEAEIRGVVLGLTIVLAALFAEISERQRLQTGSQLRRSEMLYRRLFEQSKNIIALSTPEGRLMDINQAGVDFYGASSREALLARDVTQVYAESRQRQELLEHLYRDGFVHNYPTTHRAAGGELRTVEGTTSIIRRLDGTVEFLLAILTDVTDKKRAESERTAMLAQLEAKNAELERFTAAISHDLKGPLTTILGYARLIEHAIAEGHRERVPALTDALYQAIRKMGRMIDDLLRLSQIGSDAVVRERVDAGRIAREALELLTGRIDASGVAVEVSPSFPPVTADPALLRLIFQNLIENAVKFSAGVPCPTVWVASRPPASSEAESREVTLSVADNGIGIAAGDQERIFALFQRLDDTGEGSGVGLASVQQAVELQGGRVWVESEGPGQGSTFCFTLPAAVD
jgi:PAS domain S-box-containing protein